MLNSLPSGLGHLACLQKLDLSHNLLTSLPDSLAKLASENPFMCLTSSETRFVSRGNVLRPCCAFTGLKLLDCSNNQLTCVHASLSEMTSLEQLYLRHNKLRLLPQLPATILKVTVVIKSSRGLCRRWPSKGIHFCVQTSQGLD
jgi:Leucine-rich repeat (LRR) protein